MTKRFTPRASDYTARLAQVQAETASLHRKLANLDAEERALKAFLLPFYDDGITEVSREQGDLKVSLSVTQREYLDQNKARAIITRLGKKVPTFVVDVTSFKVKFQK